LDCVEKVEILNPLSSSHPFFSDTFTASMKFEPCDAAATASVGVTDTQGLILAAGGFSEGITAGKPEHFDIPGASLTVTSFDIGEIGVYMDVNLGGNPDKLTLAVSLDICAGTELGCCSDKGTGALSHVCPSEIPIQLLEGTFSFGDNVCGAAVKPKPGGIGGAAIGGAIGAIAILGAAGFLYRRKQLKDADDCDDEDIKDDLREDLVDQVEGGDEQ
jgi:hypothetical protein